MKKLSTALKAFSKVSLYIEDMIGQFSISCHSERTLKSGVISK